MLVDEHEEGAYGSFLELPGVKVGLRSIRSQTQTESPSPAYSLKSVDRGFIHPQSSRARTYGPKGSQGHFRMERGREDHRLIYIPAR